MSPLEIEIMMHYHVGSLEDYRKGDYSAPAVQDAISRFVQSGMLKPTLRVNHCTDYITTDKGDFYCQALCKVQEPICNWYIPEIPF